MQRRTYKFLNSMNSEPLKGFESKLTQILIKITLVKVTGLQMEQFL